MTPEYGKRDQLSTGLTDAQTVGLAMVMLGAVFLAGWVVGSRIRFLHCFYIPSSIIAGFLVLLLGRFSAGSPIPPAYFRAR